MLPFSAFSNQDGPDTAPGKSGPLLGLAALCLGLVLSGCLGLGGDDDPPPASSFADASMRLYAALARQPRGTSPTTAAQESDRPAGAADPGRDREATESDEDEPAPPVAALPPDNDPGIALRVLFSNQNSALSPSAEKDLDELATQVLREDDLPIQILAYWSLADGSPSAAKLRALKRGLTLRSYLNDKGLRQIQIELTEVRAEEAPPLVVDVVLARA